MTKVKRLVAVLLSLVMIIGSFSVMGSAYSLEEDTNDDLNVTIQILKQINGEWKESDYVVPGETVKVRVNMDTDFHVGSGELIFFYDSDFFTDSLTTGTSVLASKYTLSPYYFSTTIVAESSGAKGAENGLLASQLITSEEAADNNFIMVLVDGTNTANKSLSGTFCEFELKVRNDATGTGGFKVFENTILTPQNQSGIFNLSKGEEGATGTAAKNDMFLWTVNPTIVNDQVSLYSNPSTVTFEAGEGTFAAAKKTLSFTGEANTVFEDLPANPTRAGYTFGGWATVENPTEADVVANPTSYPEGGATYYAYWVSNAGAAGTNLAINTKFFREVDGEWVETEKVKRGETVKARVYLATDYYTNAGEMILFYDKAFFNDEYSAGSNVLKVNDNPASFAAINSVEGLFYTDASASAAESTLVSGGHITADFAEDHNFIHVQYTFKGDEETSPNAIAFDDSEYLVDTEVDNDLWFAEFTFTVADSAAGEGDMVMVPETALAPGNQNTAIVNIPKGTENGIAKNTQGMWLWNATVIADSQPVRITSTVSFDANGGEFPGIVDDAATTEINESVMYVIEGDIGSAIDARNVPTPEKSGSTFLGWVDASLADPTQADVVEIPSEIDYEDKAFKALWATTVTVSFETYDGTEIADRVVAAGTDFEDVAAPEKTGYRFVGWSLTGGTDNGVSPVVTLPEKYPEADTTYYAIWEAKTYTVDYYVTDTKGNTTKVASPVIEFGKNIPTTVPTYQVPAGFELNGWYWDAALTDKVDATETMPAKNIVLYGKLNALKIDAIFNANGGAWEDGTTEKNVPTELFDTIKAPADPTRDDFVFIGWNPEVGVMDNANGKTFTANWAPVEHTITYYVEGEEPQVYEGLITGDDLEVPADPYIEGKTFLGWAETEDGTPVNPLTGTIDGKDYEYYAIFEDVVYTIDYISEGKTIDTDEYLFGEEVTVIADPAYSNEFYSFDKWEWKAYNDETGLFDIAVEEPATMPSNNLQATAVFVPNSYEVVFDANTGTIDGEATYTTETVYGEAIDGPDSTPVKPGYKFDGWTPEFVDGTTTLITAGAIYKAVWLAEDQTVTYDPNGGELDIDGLKYTTATPYVETYKTDADVTALAAEPTLTGYDFGGWEYTYEDENGEIKTLAAIPAKMPAYDITATAIWNPRNDTKYTVETYIMGTDGEYNKTAPSNSKEYTGTTGAEVSLVATPLDGYYFDEDESTMNGTIAADGSLVLKIFYGRNPVEITWDADEGYFDGDETKVDDIVENTFFGATIVAPQVDRDGYTFTGWTPAVSATVPNAEKVTYTATWKINEYDISYVVEGVTTRVDSYDFEEDVTVADAPSKTGHSFDGWVWTYVDADGNTVETTEPATMPAYDLTATAEFSPNKYKASFYTDEDTTVAENLFDEKEVEFGAEVTAPAGTPTKEGYTFGGWVDADGNDVDFSTETMDSDKGQIYFASWDAVDCTVTWDANNGIFDDDNTKTTDTTTVAFGDVISARTPAPARGGYTFAGWALEKDAKTPLTDLGVMDDVNGKTFYAVWAPTTGLGYTVEIYKMGTDGEYADTPTETIEHNDGVTGEARSVNYTAPEGFELDKDHEGYADSGIIPVAPDKLVLKIYMERNAYNLIAYVVEDDGTETEHANVEYLYGETVEALSEPTAPEGYVFKGWSTVKGDESAIAALPATMPANDYVVYAIFEKDTFTATFDSGDGYFNNDPTDKEETQDVVLGGEIQLPVEPTLPGYEFKGWSTDGTEAGIIPESEWPQAMGSDDVTYKAVWAPKTFTVTYYVPVRDADESSSTYGQLKADVWEVYGEVKTLEADASFTDAIVTGTPEILYYEFCCWQDEDGNEVTKWPETMPAKNLKYYAHFERLPVYLIPMDGSTTVIDRGEGYYGETGAYTLNADGSVSRNVTQTYDQYKADSGNVWYVYGLELYLFEDVLRDKYCDVYGDGYYTVTPYNADFGSEIGKTVVGTGSKISVYDKVTKELVEEFYVVIFGDVNGDAAIKTSDTSVMNDEIAYLTSWSVDGFDDFDSARFMAGDIVRDERIVTSDIARIRENIAYLLDIDQVTGEWISYI